MGKQVEWGEERGAGAIVCTCDECWEEHRVGFSGGDIDFRAAQAEIEGMGWGSARVKGEWLDFCSMECRRVHARRSR